MNSDRVKRAMRDAFKALKSLDPAELRHQIMGHVGGPVAELLIESGMFEGRLEAVRALSSSSFDDSTIVQSPSQIVGYAQHSITISSNYIDLGTIKVADWRPLSVGFAHVMAMDLNTLDLWNSAGIANASFAPIARHDWTYFRWEIRGSGEEAAIQEEMEWAKAA